MQWKITQNARAQPGLMQVPPRRWKTLRLRLDFKLKAVGLLKLRSASLSLLPGTPSDFDAHVMWRRQHALHLGFTVCPTYRPFNTVGEKKGESETNYMEYMSQVITLIRQKPNHDTLIHTCLLFSVYTTMAATVVIACKCPPVWVATCSHVGVPSVCAVGWQSFILCSLTWLMEPERCIFLFRSASLHSSITTFCHRS